MGLQSFSHMGICVSDLERSTRFYTDVLGFHEVFTMTLGDEFAATMEIDDCRFESRLLARDDLRVELLHWLAPNTDGDGTRRPMNLLGMTHLCFRVDEIDDLYDAAIRAGGAVHPETLSVVERPGAGGAPIKTVYLTDPDGTRIECISGLGPSGPAQARADSMGVS
jgi:glyoxylase I family protein